MEWISVKDEMPKEAGRYLIVTKPYTHVLMANFGMRGKPRFEDSCGMSLRPSHWMPLPEAPKGEG